jgi:hypothetical protein
VAALEPDEIIWDNLIYTKENQKIRNYILGLISIVFMAFAVIVTVYIEAVESWMGITFPTTLCPSLYKEKDQNDLEYKAEAWDDWQLDRE